MASVVGAWRRRNCLTQVEAASLLGISQSYLSLIEKGSRPVSQTVLARMDSVNPARSRESLEDRFREQLSALGYEPFGHFSPGRAKPAPDVLIVSILAQPDVDARIVEALPWIIRTFAASIHFPWLVQQAKLRNVQNQMGFLLRLAGTESLEPGFAADALERARLLEEATLCWESMPSATRKWIRQRRSPLAKHWNLLTTMQQEQSQYGGQAS